MLASTDAVGFTAGVLGTAAELRGAETIKAEHTNTTGKCRRFIDSPGLFFSRREAGHVGGQAFSALQPPRYYDPGDPMETSSVQVFPVLASISSLFTPPT
jgi:hypothetical protein